jgi:hypothetical protein
MGGGLMPRISSGMGASNADLDREVASRRGISSLTSGKTLELSGTPSGTVHLLPVHMMESHSSKDQVPSPESSTVHLMATSGQETSSGHQNQPDSSEESVAPMPVTAALPSERPGTAGSGYQSQTAAETLIQKAHDAYTSGDYDAAHKLLIEAGGMDATLLPQIMTYQDAVQKAKLASQASEQTPSSGGFLVP